MPSTNLAPAVSFLVLAVSAAPAFAGTLLVGPKREHRTIASAVAAAEPGDRILIDRGVYDETVDVSVPGLTITGRKGVVWRSAAANALHLHVLSGADGVTVSNIAFRGRGRGVDVDAHRFSADRCTFRACDTPIEVSGDDAKLTRLRADDCWDSFQVTGGRAVLDGVETNRGSSNGTEVRGDDARIVGCSFRGSADDYAFEVDGDRLVFERNRASVNWNSLLRLSGDSATIRGNVAEHITSDHGMIVNGSDHLIESNTVDGCYSIGIRVTGARNVIRGNTLLNTGDGGVYVQGAGFEVRGNRVYGSSDPNAGIYVDNQGSVADPSVVADNDVRDMSSNGFTILGTGVQVTGNSATDCLSRAYYVAGTGHVLSRNRSAGTGWHAFEIVASMTTLDRCVSVDAGHSGFVMAGAGSSLVRCTATDSGMHGLLGGGTGVSFENCTFLGNRLDVATSAAALVEGEGNEYVTGGPAAPEL